MAVIKKIGFGARGSIPVNAEESRIIPFVLSTYTRDRHGTVINQDNWKLDNYRKNPVIAYQHTLSGSLLSDPNPDYIIGKSVSISVVGLGKDRKLIASAQFEPADINPLAEKIFRKVLFGSLGSSSVGFLPVGEGAFGTGDEARGAINETYYFAGQELLEWSVVNIGSNPDAGNRSNDTRRMKDQSQAAIAYAFRELFPVNGLTPSKIESMSVEDVLALFDARDLGIKEKNPAKVKKLLEDPRAHEELIELERLAFRKANPRPVQNEAINTNIINIKRMKNKSVFLKALNELADKKYAGINMSQINELGIKAMKDAGLPVNNNALYLPLSKSRTVMDSSQPGTDVEVQFYAPSLSDYLVLAKAGATVLTGLRANQSFPTISGITFLSKGENVDSEDGAGSVSGVTLSPKRLTAYVDVSKLLFMQTGDGPSKLLLDNIVAAYAAKIESIVLGIAAGSSTQAQGILYKNTVGKETKTNAVVPSLTNLLALEAILDAANAQSGQVAYLSSGAGRRILQSTQRDAGGSRFLLEDEKINGLPFYFSNSVSDAAGADGLGSGLIFGKFSDLVICEFGALEIELDMISLAKEYKVRINISGFYDCKGLRPSALTSDDESTDPDNYALSFARMAIKAS